MAELVIVEETEIDKAELLEDETIAEISELVVDADMLLGRE